MENSLLFPGMGLVELSVVHWHYQMLWCLMHFLEIIYMYYNLFNNMHNYMMILNTQFHWFR
jgi:hypothetical protein